MEIFLKKLSKTIEYELKRTNRRSGSFRVAIKNGKLTVYAPSDCPVSIIEELLQERAQWIEENLTRQKKIVDRPKDTILYRGQSYPLKIKIAEKNWVSLEDAFVVNTPKSDPQVISQLLECWFKMEAERIIPKRVLELARKVGVCPQKISFRNQKTRWGSCSSSGNISLNIRLLMAPEWIFDYVIIHELCHIHEPNHSSRFWQHVAKFCPEYKEARAWLKKHGHALAF